MSHSPKPRAPQQVQILSREEREMDEVQQTIEDMKADLVAAQQILRLRCDELEFARANVEGARATVNRLTKQYLERLRFQVTGEPA